ncbi:MAG: histone deacetylase [Kangiellaceae bacterium]|jgi:acetoin utilization deacetylase AcuC-like enzyme|nr:histone deacetylase [Kangiellaceae bacterium]
MLPIVYHENYSCPFPEQHRFVMSKFRRLYDYAVDSGLVNSDKSNLFAPKSASIDELSVAHDLDYLQQLVTDSLPYKKWRRVGLPWSEGLVARTLTAPNGTLLTAQKALEHGIACHLAGGTHHAHRDFGSGFCMVNDLAYAALSLVENEVVDKVLIFDLDVHQGDGTAAILAGHPQIYTCSMHCEKNFPFRKVASDLDIGLPRGMNDDDYLTEVSDIFDVLLNRVRPDIVLYDAGVDVWQHDGLGHLNITWQGIEQRDHLVLNQCINQRIPVATVIGGGYDDDHDRLAKRHAIVVEQAHRLINRYR